MSIRHGMCYSGAYMNSEMDLTTVETVHCVGIGGIGISALARLLHHEGKHVTGNDNDEFPALDKLRAEGIPITIGDNLEAVNTDADVIIYSVAWETIAPDLMSEIRARGVLLKTYPQMLGMISKDKYTIAVAGTHGKTTTTAMIATILRYAEYDPNVIVGSFMHVDGAYTNYVAGGSNYLVVEADDYKRAFLHLYPDIAVVTNVEHDHPDYYADLTDTQDAFRDFVARTSSDGGVSCPQSVEGMARICDASEAVIHDYQTVDTSKLQLPVPGAHNRENAQAAIAAVSLMGVDEATATAALSAFQGTWRRQEYIGVLPSGAHLYDDYAHHPREVAATLAGFREQYPDRRIIVIFQPHTYSRTTALADQFVQCFEDADKVIIAPIYAARERAPDDYVGHTELARRGAKHHNAMTAAATETAIVETVRDKANAGDIVITMGAGDIYTIHPQLMNDV